MGLILLVYSLSAVTQTKKQKRKRHRRSRATYDAILQYLRDSVHNYDNNINYENYLHRGLCILCGKMTYMENLDQIQNYFYAHNLRKFGFGFSSVLDKLLHQTILI